MPNLDCRVSPLLTVAMFADFFRLFDRFTRLGDVRRRPEKSLDLLPFEAFRAHRSRSCDGNDLFPFLT
jgi:hypothetical protein